MEEVIEHFKRMTPVFICGHYRSGTSLINHLLDGHTNVLACPIETKFFSRFLPETAKGRNMDESFRDSLLRYNFKREDLYRKAFGDIPRPKFLDAFIHSFDLLNRKPDQALNAFMAAWLSFDESWTQKTHWVEKTPMNEVYKKEILSIWPRAKFIHIIRDPRDLHHTVRNRSEHIIRPRTTHHNWSRSVQHYLDALSANSEDTILLTYEKLTAEPGFQMERIAKFLQIPFQDTMLQPSSGFGKLTWDGNAQNDSFNGVSSSSVGKWRQSKFMDEIITLEIMSTSLMKKVGYVPESNPSFQHFWSANWDLCLLFLKRLRIYFREEKKATY